MLRSRSYRSFLLTLRLSQALTTGHASRYTRRRRGGHVSLVTRCVGYLLSFCSARQKTRSARIFLGCTLSPLPNASKVFPMIENLVQSATERFSHPQVGDEPSYAFFADSRCNGALRPNWCAQNHYLRCRTASSAVEARDVASSSRSRPIGRKNPPDVPTSELVAAANNNNAGVGWQLRTRHDLFVEASHGRLPASCRRRRRCWNPTNVRNNVKRMS